MNTMFYVVCIVAIVFAADIYSKYLKLKHKQSESEPELEASLQKIKTLEERIKVLERIVTEQKYDLKDEINKL